MGTSTSQPSTNLGTKSTDNIQIKVTIKCLKRQPVRVQQKNVDNDFNCSFIVNASYEPKETLKNIVDTIIRYVHEKYDPIQFVISFIDGKKSFTTSNIWDIEDQLLNESITCYKTDHIMNKGLFVMIKINYNHKVLSNDITCQYMLNKQCTTDPSICPIYNQVKQNQLFNIDTLYHIEQFTHFMDEYAQKPECKNSTDCEHYKRLQNGGNDINDVGHIKLYKHPPRTRSIQLQENIKSLVIHKNKRQNRRTYKPTKEDKIKYNCDEKNGYLMALTREVVKNGFKADLCFNNEEDIKNNKFSIMDMVDSKIKSNRHIAMNSPLNRAQMLALILYSSCNCNYDLCKSQRNGDYKKWKWFDYCLYWAIYRLSSRESGLFDVFSGLNKVKLNKKSVRCGYFPTYVSTSWKKTVAERFIEEDEGMLIKIDKTFKNNSGVFCCDISWISRFPDECEILFARSLYDWSQFECLVLDEYNGIQVVSLCCKSNKQLWENHINNDLKEFSEWIQ